jgi:hypothetical protein
MISVRSGYSIDQFDVLTLGLKKSLTIIRIILLIFHNYKTQFISSNKFVTILMHTEIKLLNSYGASWINQY